MSYRIGEVTSSRDADFPLAYAALAGEFASRGELERREVLERWVDAPPGHGPGAMDFRHTYHLLVARDERGALAGVRDCHGILDVRAGVAVAYLAHVLVLAPYRRTGVGAMLRAHPIELVRRSMLEERMDPASSDLLVAAEIEPADPDDPASLVRLAAYGRAGFSVIAPAALPYCQPDFRDLRELKALGDVAPTPRPIPLLAVVRWLGQEGATSLPKRLARAFVRHLYAVFAMHVPLDHLAALQMRTLEVLDAVPGDLVALLPLPRNTEDANALLPLSRPAVLPLFPEELR